MMQCRNIDELMVDFLYDELDAAQADEFRRHVDGCERCGAELASFSRTRFAVNSLPQLEPAPAISAQLLHEAARRASRQNAGEGILGYLSRLLKSLAAQPAWAAAATIVLVAGVAGLLSVRGRLETQPASEPAPPATATMRPPAEAPVAAAPPTAGTDSADRLREVREVGAKPNEEAPKVAAPAVAVSPAKKRAGYVDSTAGESGRLGRAASDTETKNLAVVGKTGATDDGTAVEKLGDFRPKSIPSASVQEKAERDIGGAPAPVATKQAGAYGELDEDLKAAISSPRDDRAPSEPEAPVPAPSSAVAAQHQAAPSAMKPKASIPAQANENFAPPSQPVADSAETIRGAAIQQEGAPVAPQGTVQMRAKDAKESADESERLLVSARQQAVNGRCGDALALGQKLAQSNPEFYRRRVANDPTLNACAAGISRKVTKSPLPEKRRADQEQQQRNSDRAVDKAAH